MHRLTIFEGAKCCPADSPLYDCTWRGSAPDCANAKCEKDEVAVDLESQGDGTFECNCELII